MGEWPGLERAGEQRRNSVVLSIYKRGHGEESLGLHRGTYPENVLGCPPGRLGRTERRFDPPPTMEEPESFV